MNANHLLYWLSARREGSWQQFRAAVEELHLASRAAEEGEEAMGVLPLYQQYRFSLAQLGHVEFLGSDLGWRVAPPVLAASVGGGGCTGILCGARLPALVDRVLEGRGECQAEVISQESAPDLIRLSASHSDELQAIARRAGVRMQADASRAILAVIPPVDDVSIRVPAEVPAGGGWKVSRFSVSQVSWVAASREEAVAARAGLYRFNYYHEQRYLLIRNGRAFSMNGQAAKYVVLRTKRRRGVVRYSKATETVTVPAVYRPPPLVDRALVLCTGKLPNYDAASGLLAYAGISQDIASFAANLLRQEIR